MAFAQITTAGKVVTARTSARPPLSVISRIDKNRYLYKPTGEVRCYKHRTPTPTVARASLPRTFARLRDLIRCNFIGGNKELFITLTYADNVTDPARLAHDLDLFFKRLKRMMAGHELQYIAVIEPQERGAWHVHLMLKSDKMLYIPDKQLRGLWRQGITQTERLHNADDLGAYYVTYFTDLLSTEHKRRKGARLGLYPAAFKFYRCSQGIVRPQTVVMPNFLTAANGAPSATWQVLLLKPAEEEPRGYRLVNIYHYAQWSTHAPHKNCCETCNNCGTCCMTCTAADRHTKVILIGADYNGRDNDS
jgi:hypothetical protein